MITLLAYFCEEFREDKSEPALAPLTGVCSGCTEFEDGIEVKQL